MKNVVEVLLGIVLPIFGLVYAGYYFRRLKICTEEWVHALNEFVFYVSLPAVIGISFWEMNVRDPLFWSIVGSNTAIMFLYAGLLFFGLHFFSRLRGSLKAAAFLAGMVGNTVYMGFPLLADAFGQARLPYGIAAATIQLVLGLVLSLQAVEYWVVKSKKSWTYFLDFFKNPFFIALLAGTALSLLNFKGPVAETIRKPIYMLGATASPVALFALGGFLHGKFLRHHLSRAVWVSAVKLLAFPVFAWLFAVITGMHRDFAAMSVIAASMPSAVTAFVVAEKYHLDEELVVNSILLSTAVSLITISVFLAKFI
ncbi:MAG: AEC family transporter [Patescibacteria group bacterium]|nr:AEC family transporter [Patescibacteria group bacterium]